ncbi:hypothetical protein ACFLZ8_02270 [Planctomycetota bacterium]
MRDEKKEQKPKRTVKRIITLVLILILFLFILIVLAVPVFVSSATGRRFILSKINNADIGTADFTYLSMGWFKGIKIDDLSFDDSSGQVSVKVKQVATEPQYRSLLVGNLAFGKTKIDSPQIDIKLKPKQPKEISTATQSKNAPVETLGIAFVTDIEVSDGKVRLTGEDDNTVELKNINSNVNLRLPGSESSFELDMIVAAADKESTVTAEGRITPVKQNTKSGWTFTAADSDIAINVGELNLESLEPFLAMAGVDIKAKGNISVDIQSRFVGGEIDNISGTIKGSQLEIETGQAQEKIQTSVLDVDLKLTRNEQMINIENAHLTTDWAEIDAGGTIPTNIKSLDSFLSADADYDLSGTFDLDLAAVVSQIPTTLGLKEGMEISSGTITGNINTIGSAGQKQLQAAAELADLKGSVEGKQIALSAPILAEAQVSPGEAGVNVDNLVVSAPFMKINAAGNLENVKFDGQADLAMLQAELGQFVDIGPYKIAGQFVETGMVSISEKAVALTGSSTIEGLDITGPNDVRASVPRGEITYALNLERENNILNVNSLEGDMSFGQFNIKDALVPLDIETDEPLSLTVAVSQIDLAKLLPFAVLFGGLPEGTELAGIAESQVSVSSQKQIYTIKSDSTQVGNLKFAYPDNIPIEQDKVTIVFETELDIAQKNVNRIIFRLESPQLNIPQANISQQNQDGKTKLSGQVELEYDWSAVSSIAGPYMPEGLELQGQRTDNISFASEYPIDEPNKLLVNLTANAGLGFEQAGYMGLDFGPTDVNIVVENGLLQIPFFTTTVNEGQLNFAARADFTQQPAVFTTPVPLDIIKDIQLNDPITQQLLKYLNPLFGDASNVSGIANLSCEKLSIPLDAEEKNSAEIVGTVSVTQLTLQTSGVLGQILTILDSSTRSSVITIHPTNFVLRDGYLRYDNMQVDIGNNPVNFEGVIGLDKSLNMTVTLPYTTDGRTVRVGDSNARRITLPFKGTVDKPEIDMGKLLENQLKNEIENQILRGLEDIFG